MTKRKVQLWTELDDKGHMLRTVKMVEHDPAADRVVRAAVEWWRGASANDRLSLFAAIEAYELKGRKK